MKELKLIAIVEKLVQQKISESISNIRGPRGLKGKPGESFNWEEYEDQIYSQIKKEIKQADHLKLKFSDLTEEERDLLKGEKGSRGEKGISGKSFNWEDHKDDISLIISSYIESIKDCFKLKFDDLTDDEIEQIRGRRGQRGKEGLRGAPGRSFIWEDHQEKIFKKVEELVNNNKKSFKLKFEDLTQEQKDQLSFSLDKLSDEQIELIKGPKGERGLQGKIGKPGQSACDIWLNNGNIGDEVDFLKSLIGSPGVDGAQGVAGRDGQDGQDGLHGRDGKDAAYIVDIEIDQSDDDSFSFIFIFSDGSEIQTSQVELPEIKQIITNAIATVGGGGGSQTDAESTIDQWASTGLLSGNGISDNGDGTVSVGSGVALIRATDSDTDTLIKVEFNTASSVALTDNQQNFIYLEYNSGSPQIVAATSERTDINTNVILGTVYRSGTDVHINDYHEANISNGVRKTVERFLQVDGIERASGLEVSATGTRNFAVTAGNVWQGLENFTLAAIDTSVASTFTYLYRDGVGGWTEVASQTQIDNDQYDDGSGTLASAGLNKYLVHFVYREADEDTYVVYGQDEYNTQAFAEDAEAPGDLPSWFPDHAILCAKIIIQKSASSFATIQSAFAAQFSVAAVTDHGNLAGLGDDDHTQYHNDARAETWLAAVPSTPVDAANDELIFIDATDSGIKRTTITDIESSITITESQISDLAHYTDSDVETYLTGLSSVTPEGSDLVVIEDVTDNTLKQTTITDLVALAGGGGDYWVHADPSIPTGLSTFTLPTATSSVFIAPETDGWNGTAAGSGATQSVMIGHQVEHNTGTTATVAIGYDAESGLRSVSIGHRVFTSSDCVTIGYLAAGAYAKCTLIGGTLSGAQPIGEIDAVGVGAQVRPSRYGTAVGIQAGAGWYSVAIGKQADAGNSYVWEQNVAIGYLAKCRGARRIAIGSQCESTANYAYSMGWDHINGTSYTFAVGYSSTTWGIIGRDYWQVPANGQPFRFGANNYGIITRDNNEFSITADANDILKLSSSGGAIHTSSTTKFVNTEEFVIENPNSQVSIIAPTYIGGVSTTGSDLVTNGTFASATSWSVTGWTISGGIAYVSGVSSTNLLQQTIFVTSGKWYKVQFTVGDYSNSPEFDLVFSFAGYTAPTISNFGTYEYYFKATTSGGVVNFQFDLDVLTSGGVSVDDVSLYEVSADGILQNYGTTTTEELTVNGDSVTIATSKTPSSASDTGTTGQVAWDSNYIYVCTATNTWVRAALSTW